MKNDNQLDLAFVCDGTSSMGCFMDAAKQEMMELIEVAAKASDVDVRFGLVVFRDHGDNPVTKTHAFTADVEKAKAYINTLSPWGGGDWPEAVFDGVQEAVKGLKWHLYARRIILLVGDAPPHGTAGSASHPEKCKCNKTIAETTAMAEEHAITLHGICLTDSTHFEEIAHITGGMTFDATRHGDAMKEVKRLIEIEFGDIKFDRKVLELHQEGMDQNQIGDELEATPYQVGSSLGRLGNRNLLGDLVLESAQV